MIFLEGEPPINFFIMEKKEEKYFFDHIKKQLYTAVVGDIMDQLGYQNQFLNRNIKPLRKDMVVIGRAMPVLEADTLDNSSNSSN